MDQRVKSNVDLLFGVMHSDDVAHDLLNIPALESYLVLILLFSVVVIPNNSLHNGTILESTKLRLLSPEVDK
eukprot:CAMPEP_0178892776 /NCGR_PEP_ID=MMETSP0747-20121128/19672_1 /TAXON_ID=913974 /ORGANISM="Nitzschia punctata, Strain CCMP561" /LENGTH=71 /DNA_ID=CAMNT_0020562749 /DNA_START=729 /DNA_END=944 /DNA_ORIENTATION=-